MKHRSNSDWEWEKKPRRVEKGTDKAGKHRKSLYNILSDFDENDIEFDSESGDVKPSYNGNFNYTKRR